MLKRWERWRAQQAKKVNRDWAKVTNTVVNRCLRASEKVGPTADFATFAAEFALGPAASAGRKRLLKQKLEEIVVRHTRDSRGRPRNRRNEGDHFSMPYFRELSAALKRRQVYP